MAKKRFLGWKWIALLVVLIVILVGVWFVFFYYADCDSWGCFDGYLEECSRVKFIGGEDMVYEYSIEGRSDSTCEVSVQLLVGQLDNQDSIKLEGQRMTCMLPRGVVMIPESDIGRCHGLLKEGLQDLVIEKLHTYLVQNLGRINLEILDIPGVN